MFNVLERKRLIKSSPGNGYLKGKGHEEDPEKMAGWSNGVTEDFKWLGIENWEYIAYYRQAWNFFGSQNF